MKNLIGIVCLFFLLSCSVFSFQVPCLSGFSETPSLDKTTVQPGNTITLTVHIATTNLWPGGNFQLTTTLFNESSGPIPVDNERKILYLPAGVQALDIVRPYVVPCFYGGNSYDWYWRANVRDGMTPSNICLMQEVDFTSNGMPLCQ